MSRGHLVFVYGTLKSTEGASFFLGGAKSLGKYETVPEFSLYNLYSYPAVKQGGNTSIKGEVYEVTDEILSKLDAYEGHPSLYKREEIQLTTDEFDSVFMYIYQDSIYNAQLNHSGEWLSQAA